MQPVHSLQCRHVPVLVVLSYVISVVGSFCYLTCVVQLPHLRRKRFASRLALASVTMGGCIWSMHFIAMTACRLPVPVSYDPTLTALSLVVAVVVSAVGLYVVRLNPTGGVRLLAGGLVTGLGIAEMHYIGMAAMRMPDLIIRYEGGMVLASVLIGIAAATLALWLAFNLHHGWQRLGSAFIMGGAVSGMHYTGMAAAIFAPGSRPVVLWQPLVQSNEIGFTVFWVTLWVLALLLMESRVTDERRLAVTLRASEQCLERTNSVLRDVARSLVTLQEDERRTIARELHDEIGQLLTGLSLMIGAGQAPDSESKRQEMLKVVDELLERVQDLSLNLRPPMLDDLGLVPTLRWQIGRFEERTGIRVDFSASNVDRRFPPEIELTAFRVIQEALTNVARHSGVTEVKLELWADPQTLGARIEDRGKGFNSEEASINHSAGLMGMRERCRQLGGRLSIESTPGGGTRIAMELPLQDRSTATR
jgi:signal transduction histidine kinase